MDRIACNGSMLQWSGLRRKYAAMGNAAPWSVPRHCLEMEMLTRATKCIEVRACICVCESQSG